MRSILIAYSESGRDPALSSEAMPTVADTLPDWIQMDDSYRPVPVGGVGAAALQGLPTDPPTSQAYVLRASIDESDLGRVPDQIGPGRVFADPQIASLTAGRGTAITCGTSPAVGDYQDVQAKLNVPALHAAGATGQGTALAIMDSGVNENHLLSILPSVNIDKQGSWQAPGHPSPPSPGRHPLGHGTMCAFDALIVAPDTAVLDYPILSRPGPPSSTWFSSVLSNALAAYAHLLAWWSVAFGPSRGRYHSLVVSNSWSMSAPNWDLPRSHPGRYQDNPNHPFSQIVAALASHDIDILFGAGNCGSHCPDPRCGPNMPFSITGANAHPDVICVGGVDTNDQWVGYSSEGPAITNVDPKKPDLAAYTHFLGSMVAGRYSPDAGTSAACPVAAGCVAALRSNHDQSVASVRRIASILESSARKPAGSPVGWDRKLGYGILDPVVADSRLP